ncbi:MAG TPA: 4-alpha-glucanotransferase [Clostridia bacterium]|nr:4-alpha-glucanotransferase [Clostridia bacterium]
MRGSGVLLNISSLPSEFGIGGFGEEIVKFAEFLKRGDCKWWQVLPMTTIGLGESPYSGVSAFAGNYLYIDPFLLRDKGFITYEECDSLKYYGSPYVVDYEFCYNQKRRAVQMAYNHIMETDTDVLYTYANEQRDWLIDYAIFMALKDLHGGKPWFEWEDKFKYHDHSAIGEFMNEYSRELGYYICEQYLFEQQWQMRKEQINQMNIGIIGDMPIYVSYDSVDVWANPQYFDLDENYKPKKVAGVPPDYFCAEGQLWGNPLYNYDEMRKDNFRWFCNRIERMFKLYDKLRIDHFRAFDRYWAVEYGAKNAIEGEWCKGIGRELFAIVRHKFPKADIIAEDLGVIDDGVIDLRERTGFPGMRVLQFAFDSEVSPHMPHNYERNCIAYTGTHDNTTIYGWLASLGADARAKLYDYIGEHSDLEGGENSRLVWACIRTMLLSVADIVIIPFQDLAGWGEDTRMNIPGKATGNWRPRVTYDAIDRIRIDRLRRFNYLSNRN